MICLEEISDKMLKSVAIHISEITDMSATLVIKDWQCVQSAPVFNIFNSVEMDISDVHKRTQDCINTGMFKSFRDQCMNVGQANVQVAK